MSYEVRLDRWAAADDGRGSSYSTTIIAEENGQSIHWGNASYHGDTNLIVTVKVGFLSVTVDEHIIGKDKLIALRDSYHFKAVERREKLHATIQTSSTNRYDAAVAAAAAGQYVVACESNPSVVFDMIVVIALRAFAQAITPEHVAGVLKAAASVGADHRRRGYADAKTELRRWLYDDAGGVWS